MINVITDMGVGVSYLKQSNDGLIFTHSARRFDKDQRRRVQFGYLALGYPIQDDVAVWNAAAGRRWILGQEEVVLYVTDTT